MENKVVEPNLLCVLFPGVVKNDEKALQCLGGIRTISEVYSNISKKRLGLSFQPDNPFVNKIYGDPSKSTGVLLKVKVKKKKTETGIQREVVSTAVVGRVPNIFKFDGMADFQYLPVHKEEGKPLQCIREHVLPTELASVDFLLKQAMPYLTPELYTRTDRPYPYYYTTKKVGKDTTTTPAVPVLSKVPTPTMVAFSLTEKLPAGPTKHQVACMDKKTQHSASEVEVVVKALNERPIWSMNRISHHTNLRRTVLRFILPSFAFYYTNGPWRKCWVKYGYEPRKDPNARFYQILDFRVRGELTKKVSLRFQEFRRADRVISLTPSLDEHVSEGSVIFREGVKLTQRQIFYQFCDIQLPEVQELLQEEPQPGMLCHATHGWLSPSFDQTCRDHVVRVSKATLVAHHVADLKYEQPSSGDEGGEDNDDDDDTFASDNDNANNDEAILGT